MKSITFLLYGSAHFILEKRYEKEINIIIANLIDSGMPNYLLITLFNAITDPEFTSKSAKSRL